MKETRYRVKYDPPVGDKGEHVQDFRTLDEAFARYSQLVEQSKWPKMSMVRVKVDDDYEDVGAHL